MTSMDFELSADQVALQEAARDLLDERPALIGVNLLKHSVEVGRDGATIEQARQQRDGAGDILWRREVAFEIEIETILAERLDKVVHHSLVVAARFETLPHGRGVKAGVIAQPEQVFLPLWATGALGHAGADKGDDEAPLARALQFLEPHKITWKLVSVEDAGLLFRIEPAASPQPLPWASGGIPEHPHRRQSRPQ